jgi:hypothetical protein
MKNNNGLIEERFEHPSYATLKFSRRHGGNNVLFGSSIKHADTIALTLSHASLERGLNNDWIYCGGTIAEAEMSYSQFAEAITSMNMGSGVPVTLRFLEKEGNIPKCDFINKRDQFRDEFKDKLDSTMETTKNLIKEVNNLFTSKKSLNKTDKEEILNKLSKIYGNISHNAMYVCDQFDEQIDKTIMEAKGEIEAFYQNKLNSIAYAAIAENIEEIKLLENPVDM